MKIAVLGAGGVRAPLMMQAFLNHQDRIGLTDLALMDIDGEHLELIGAITAPLERSGRLHFNITRTTNARQALDGADFVITTFRVGGIASRAVDESVPLRYGVLGQETTGPGGFAMGMRTIPVLIEYTRLMAEVCRHAWLINFANPSGMLAEMLHNVAGWKRAVGICDGPSGILNVASAVTGIPVDDIFMDYFGLNHLGWARSLVYNQHDYLPEVIAKVKAAGGSGELAVDADLIAWLGMIPNEYLYYYYNTRQSVANILRAEVSRGAQIAALNQQLFTRLQALNARQDYEGMRKAYFAYLDERSGTYMQAETGHNRHINELDELAAHAASDEGYAGVALNLIEGLAGSRPRAMILNVPNRGAIAGMDEDDVVETQAFVDRDQVHPLATGTIPAASLGLMKQVKAYEKLTIQAAVEGSYGKALQALTLHPLVADLALAKKILDGYIQEHGELFPKLK